MALGFWAKDYLGPKEAGGGSGGSVMCVYIAYEDATFTADVSYADVVEAIESGTTVFAYDRSSDALCMAFYDESDSVVYGVGIGSNDSQLIRSYFEYSSEGLTVTIKAANITWE